MVMNRALFGVLPAIMALICAASYGVGFMDGQRDIRQNIEVVRVVRVHNATFGPYVGACFPHLGPTLIYCAIDKRDQVVGEFDRPTEGFTP